MSFGVGISDILKLITIVNNTIQNCRHAPIVFSEALDVCQSLVSLLENVQAEMSDSNSVLYQDERTKMDFALHLRNCETSVNALSEFVSKHQALSSLQMNIVDRLKFSKRTYLELRGNLAFYSARLHEFLQVIGLGSLGRIERKVDEVQDFLPQIMSRIDEWVAEARISTTKESLLSDHTDDEKYVWKTFRSELVTAGFTSNVIQEHQTAIFLRIRELTGYGLLESDTGTSCATDDDLFSEVGEDSAYRLPLLPNVIYDSEADDAASEKTLTPRPSKQTLRSKQSASTMKLEESMELRSQSASDGQTPAGEPRSNYINSSPPQHSDVVQSSSSEPPKSRRSRVWRNVDGHSVVRGDYMGQKSGYTIVADSQGDELKIWTTNLSDADQAFIQSFENPPAPVQYSRDDQKRLPSPVGNEKYSPSNPKVRRLERKSEETLPPYEPVADAVEVGTVDESPAIEIPRRARPKRLYGRRSQAKISYFYRYTIPDTVSYRARGYLPIHDDSLPAAAAEGKLNKVKSLLKQGANIEAIGPKSYSETYTYLDSEGNTQTGTHRYSFPETTALYRAADKGHFDVALYLLSCGADVNARNGYDGNIGDPILIKVIRMSDERMVRLLLEFNARQHAFGRITALHVACGYPNKNIVRDCLEFGAKIDALNGMGESALFIASEKGFDSIVRILLQEGAIYDTVTKQNYTPLYKAAGRNYVRVVEHLLNYGADPALGRGRQGETAMYKAAWFNFLDVIDLLIAHKADPNIVNEAKMKSYKSAGEKIAHGIVAGLSTRHALFNSWAKTPLHAAAYRGHDELVTTLLEAGAHIDQVGGDGMTPVYLAAQQHHATTTQLLLNAGAKLDTERHDPVLALLSEKNKNKNKNMKRSSAGTSSMSVLLGQKDERDMARIGTGDGMVNFVAEVTKMFARSRRGL